MIKSEKGIVTYVMRTGGTFVKSTMPLASANAILKCSKNVEETDKRGYGIEICVDDKYFFPIEPVAEETPVPCDEEVDEVTE